MKAHAAAAGAAAGSLVAGPVPMFVLIIALGAAVMRRSAISLAVGAAALCSVLGAHALDGLTPPPAGPMEGWVTLTSDPRPYGTFGVRAGARWGDVRVTVTAHGPLAGRLDDALAGERVQIAGRFRAASASDEWARWRHEVGSITVDAVRRIERGSPVTRLANSLRRALSVGAASLDRDDRAVFLGMVIGDDRSQSAVTADDFRAAGLGHLLVVSGQNVAFVVAVLMPLVGAMRPGPRFLVLLVALGFFALVTRFEPSVLRAVAMAGVGVGAAALGSPVDGRRALSTAIAVLLVIDPFLVHVLAFRLSVAATAGIVWFAQPLAERVPGPLPFRVALATTVVAQLAVSPLLVATFGPMPLASLPANLLAGPASGPIMVWGCTGGVVAGVAGGTIAAAIHWPTDVLVSWVRWVAHRAAVAPPATVGPVSLCCLGVSAAVAIHGGTRVRRAAAGAAIVVVGASLAAVPAPSTGWTEVGAGVTVVATPEAVVLVLDDPRRAVDVVELVREAGVRRVDAIVASDGDAADAYAVIALVERYGVATVLAPPLHRVPGASSVRPGIDVLVGGVAVRVGETTDPELVVCAPSAAPCHDGRQEAP